MVRLTSRMMERVPGLCGTAGRVGQREAGTERQPQVSPCCTQAAHSMHSNKHECRQLHGAA